MRERGVRTVVKAGEVINFFALIMRCGVVDTGNSQHKCDGQQQGGNDFGVCYDHDARLIMNGLGCQIDPL